MASLVCDSDTLMTDSRYVEIINRISEVQKQLEQAHVLKKMHEATNNIFGAQLSDISIKEHRRVIDRFEKERSDLANTIKSSYIERCLKVVEIKKLPPGIFPMCISYLFNEMV